MEKLWAPWRMEYIEDLKSSLGDECFLCEHAKNPDDDLRFVLARGKHVFVILNRYPYNCGHLMVVPYKHVKDLSKLDSNEYAELMSFTSLSVEILKDVLGAEGFNCGLNLGKCAGAGLETHLHMHIVPRWMGDTNFFPVLGKTKSMPEYLGDTYKKLKPAFEEWERGSK